MERCPNCRARWDGNASCRRCGMDLDPLIAVEQTADASIARGIVHLAEADPPSARRDLMRALALHRTDFAQLLLGFAEWCDAGGGDHPPVIGQGLDRGNGAFSGEPPPGLPPDPPAGFDGCHGRLRLLEGGMLPRRA